MWIKSTSLLGASSYDIVAFFPMPLSCVWIGGVGVGVVGWEKVWRGPGSRVGDRGGGICFWSWRGF